MSTEEIPFIFDWTGREAASLQTALRMTNEQYADHLGVAVRTVAKWRATPTIVPRNEAQQLLDSAYRQAARDTHTVRRFLHALTHGPEAGVREVTSPVVMAAEMTLMQARINELTEQLNKTQKGAA